MGYVQLDSYPANIVVERHIQRHAKVHSSTMQQDAGWKSRVLHWGRRARAGSAVGQQA